MVAIFRLSFLVFLLGVLAFVWGGCIFGGVGTSKDGGNISLLDSVVGTDGTSFGVDDTSPGEDGTSLCIFICGDKECGEDGCGGICGTCFSVAPVCMEGLC